MAKFSIKSELLLIFLIILILVQPNLSEAQVATSEGDPDLDAIEAELLKSSPPEPKPNEKVNNEPEKKTNFKYSDLKYLAPFSQVTVIQKRYLPKTNRMQLNLGGNYLTNNPFFQGVGLIGRLGFYFTEYLGLEVSAMKLNINPKQVTQDLSDFHKVKTATLVSSDSYTGVDLIYSPFYGKMTWLDRAIVPFDTFITLGLGSTKTTTSKSAPTLHLGLGQTLAINKDLVFRWDLSSNNYSVDVDQISSMTSGSTGAAKKQQFNDLFLGIGVSLLFPGAKYR